MESGLERKMFDLILLPDMHNVARSKSILIAGQSTGQGDLT